MKRIAFLLGALLVAGVVSVGCGSSDDEGGAPNTQPIIQPGADTAPKAGAGGLQGAPPPTPGPQ